MKISKELKTATEAMYTLALAKQELTKKFQSTPKTSTSERNQLKLQLIDLHKKLTLAEKQVNKILSTEDCDV